uniref:hypothetical protein n=1 Tax=Streptomyces noursei TaxID=1971 RepID=UPI0015952599|nr:hypothetical protein [Streptomyces noursei]
MFAGRGPGVAVAAGSLALVGGPATVQDPALAAAAAAALPGPAVVAFVWVAVAAGVPIPFAYWS